jgi:pimeloyl-ACP methyl ester carboxylesterase
VTGIFLPGWGATPRLYAAGLPDGWEALELPALRATRGELPAYRSWLAREVDRRGRVAVAGHSMGAALGLLVTVDRPELVERLVLVSPAGLPLTKSMTSSVAAFVRQVATGRYRLAHVSHAMGRVAVAPRSALRLARAAHGLDVTPEVERFRATRVPCTVVGCTTDTLTPAAHCRRLAELIGAEYREVDAADGHIWPVTHPHLLKQELGE